MKGRLRWISSIVAGLFMLSLSAQGVAQPGPIPSSGSSSGTQPATNEPQAAVSAESAPSVATADSTNEPSPTTDTTTSEQAEPPGRDDNAKEQAPPARTSGETAAEPEASTPCQTDAYAGPPTLLGGKATLGGYGGVVVAYSRFDGDDGVLIGGEGAFLIDHRVSVGVAGYGWLSDGDAVVFDDGVERRMELGYGGAVLRYAFLTDYLVYASLGALVGGGAVVMVPNDDVVGRDDTVDEDDVDRFFVFEPQLSAHSNVTRWMRVGLQAGYRLTAGISKFGHEDSTMRGPVVGGTLQFGWL